MVLEKSLEMVVIFGLNPVKVGEIGVELGKRMTLTFSSLRPNPTSGLLSMLCSDWLSYY